MAWEMEVRKKDSDDPSSLSYFEWQHYNPYANLTADPLDGFTIIGPGGNLKKTYRTDEVLQHLIEYKLPVPRGFGTIAVGISEMRKGFLDKYESIVSEWKSKSKRGVSK